MQLDNTPGGAYPRYSCIKEAESKEKYGVWDPIYAGVDYITSPYVHSRVDSMTYFTMDN
jgi:hypothetical protein